VTNLEITKPKVIVAEGRDEENFFEAIIEHIPLVGIQVIGVGGKTMIKQNLKGITSLPYFKDIVTSVGVVRDADNNPTAAFESVCDALRNADLPVPTDPMVPIGPLGNKPKVVVMILPGNNNVGMLEDLCLRAVQSDPATPCMEGYFECLHNQNVVLSPDLSVSKAKVQAFLASRKEPDLCLGIAAKKGYWPWDNEAFEIVERFLQLLVDL
jgi:hypothetical protein